MRRTVPDDRGVLVGAPPKLGDVHNIRIDAHGSANFAFAERSGPAWHGLGRSWPEGTSLEVALALAGADYEVRAERVYVRDNSGGLVVVPGRVATVRDDEAGRPVTLGVVSEHYRIVQNAEAFSFASALLDGGAIPDAVGVLGRGERAFATFRIGEDILIGGEDAVNLYLVAITGHDGGQAVTCLATPVRAVCQNTVRMALGKARTKWALRHRSTLKGRLAEARHSLEMAFAASERFSEIAERMLATPVTRTQALMAMVPELAGQRWEDLSAQKRREIQELEELLDAPTNRFGAGTAWASWNAYVEYLDWSRPVHGKGAERYQRRATASLVGDTDERKAEVARRLLAGVA